MIAIALTVITVMTCLFIVGIAELIGLKQRLATLERKERRRVKADRLQKLRDRRKR